jgi:hypothetical protein
MLAELSGKAGGMCSQAREGEIRCPLLVRPNSEDVITSHLWGTLKHINPRHWVAPLLNRALGENVFRPQYYRRFQVDLWEKQPRFPREHLTFDEGQTEVDVILRWENPATTVFIEMKYGSPLSPTTSNNSGTEVPSDQLIRNIRMGLYTTGWYREQRLYPVEHRNFIMLVMTPKGKESLVDRYRNLRMLKDSLPASERLIGLPSSPFIGQLSYPDVVTVLKSQEDEMSEVETGLARQLSDYLSFKSQTLGRLNESRSKSG